MVRLVMIRLRVVVGLVLVLGACSTAPPRLESRPPDTSEIDSPGPDSSGSESSAGESEGSSSSQNVAVATVAYELRECGSGSVPVVFAVLCEAYDRLESEYVDPIDPAGLAAAAALGLRSGKAEPLEEAPTETLRCYVPDPAFEVVCAELTDGLAAGSGSAHDLVQNAVLGMFRYGLDPFSAYVPDEQSVTESFLAGFIYDLGFVVTARDPSEDACSPVEASCRLTIVSVFDFTPADTEGLRVGDVVVEVDGQSPDGLGAEEAAALLWGDPGETVSLTVDRAGQLLDFALVRADIRFDPAEFEILDSGHAYIRLNEFSQPAAIALGSALARPDVSGAPGLILDLRDNPGGLVLAAQAVASQFLDSGDVMVEAYRDDSITIPVIEGGLATGAPRMVVLVNGASASAAEIVAAVLTERGRATVMGTSTFGKNLVQLVAPSRDGGEIRITAARWETPGGLDVGLVGLQPDIVVEDDGPGDPQMEAAIKHLS